MPAVPDPESPPRDPRTLLRELVREEATVSRRRKQLFDRLDLSGDQSNRERYEQEERALSAYRRGLHERIDALRAELEAGRPHFPA